MKYFLAVDKGPLFSLKDRYVSLDLSFIEDNLVEDNNLKSLTDFTMGFENQSVLKLYLLEKNILTRDKLKYDLCIIYKRDYYRFLSIPFAPAKKYFDMSNLADTILKNASNPAFVRNFLNYFRNDKYNLEAYYELKRAFLDYFPDYILFDKIRGFLNAVCYSDKGSFRYRSFFDIAMFVSDFMDKSINSKKDSKTLLETKKEFLLDAKKNLTEAQQFQLEEWESRRAKKEIEGQTNLFKM